MNAINIYNWCIISRMYLRVYFYLIIILMLFIIDAIQMLVDTIITQVSKP